MLCFTTVSLFIAACNAYRLVYNLDNPAYLPRELRLMDSVPDVNNIGLPGFATPFDECIYIKEECPNENVTFWLYTRSNQDNPFQIDETEPEFWKRIPSDRGKPWVMIIHGYKCSKDDDPNLDIRPAYFQKGDFNIISVDYSPLVRSPCYLAAVANVPIVARCTARMIDRLVEQKVFELSELHVIGFSLGGQVTGYLREYLMSGTIKRMTDPALPLFIGVDNMVDPLDAEFVQVIHTNAAMKGQLAPLGHVDFYPNGGYTQPGCMTSNGSITSCNHARAPAFFAESINTDVGFWAVPCGSLVTYYWGWCPANETNQVLMGEYLTPDARGIYYLSTNYEKPFALGKQLINEETHD